MIVSERVRGTLFPCSDVNQERHMVPSIDIEPAAVLVVLISEAAPANPSELLEMEIEPFTQVKAYLLMGDVAIRCINQIARRHVEPRVILPGSTYKIRGGQFFFRGGRAFPSYLQAGPNFFIEKSKRRMIAEDIAAALSLAA